MRKLFFLAAVLMTPFLILSVVNAQFDLGSVEVQVSGSSGTLDTGDFGEVGRFRVSNRTGRNVELESLRLRNYGTAELDESFDNVFLTTTTGERLAELVDASRRYWTWRFLPGTVLKRGDSLLISVKARLIYAERGDTEVQLGFRRLEDFAVKDIGSGFGVRCDNCEGIRLQPHRLDIGGLTISRSSNFRAARFRGSNPRTSSSVSSNQRILPTASSRTRNFYYRPTTVRHQERFIAAPRGSQQYSPGARDVIFFSSRLSSRTGVAVDGLFLEVGSGSNSVAGFNNAFGDWRLLVNGVSEDTTNEIETYRGRNGVLFNSNIIIPPNAQITLIGRVTNQAQTGDKIRFSLNSSGLIDPEHLSTSSRVRSINGSGGSNFSSVR